MRGPLRPDMQLRRPNPPKDTPGREMDHENPVQATDAEVYQAEPVMTTLPVVVVGPVRTQAMPTVASGSRNVTVTATGTALKVGSADPRRASLTIITNQPTYVSSSHAQCELGTAALIPANVGIVITHGQDVWVGMPAANTFPATVAVMSEQWAY